MTDSHRAKTYVSEVQNAIDAGLPAHITTALFDVLTEHFEDIAGSVETPDFRRNVANLRKHERGHFHAIIDDVCGRYPLPVAVGWREVKFEPRRITRCEVCSRYFYDHSRNGKRLTCSDQHARDYRNFIRTGGTAIDPIYKRKVEEVPMDFSPAQDDAQGHARLSEVEDAWRRAHDREKFFP